MFAARLNSTPMPRGVVWGRSVRPALVGVLGELEHAPVVVAERSHLGEVERERTTEIPAQLGDPGHLLVDA